jgi:glycosyltransferase involved in cell wall biosynthesis
VTDRTDDRVSSRIAVVPAYNEEATVRAVLDRLYDVVDELVVVDDGSTDRTRAVVEDWLPGRNRARLLTLEVNQGMSAAYYLAFSEIAHRVATGVLDANSLICTIDADGQHDPHSLERLVRIASDERLDALLVRRDLSGYPPYKRLGNAVLSRWATYWARSPLFDVESGYRVFRAAALADALRYYRGYKYSETVEVAVVLCRLGYRVRNDVVLPVPIFRSRTRLRDAVIDFAMIVVAARRAAKRRALPRRPVPASAVPVTVSTLALGAANRGRRSRGSRRTTPPGGS